MSDAKILSQCCAGKKTPYTISSCDGKLGTNWQAQCAAPFSGNERSGIVHVSPVKAQVKAAQQARQQRKTCISKCTQECNQQGLKGLGDVEFKDIVIYALVGYVLYKMIK